MQQEQVHNVRVERQRDQQYKTGKAFGGPAVGSGLGERILGRVALEDVQDPITGAVLVEANREIDENLVNVIESAGIERVLIRSVLTCQTRRGVCAACYGRDLARGYEVNIGEAVGVIAAQSIGEPGTQLTMRTFHIGGAAARGKVEQSSIVSRVDGIIRLENTKTVKKKDGNTVIMNRHGVLKIVDESGRERESYNLSYGALSISTISPIRAVFWCSGKKRQFAPTSRRSISAWPT